MVKSKLVLAVAGAGKTYFLADQLNKKEKNIYITFTNQNVKNIVREIKKIHGELPKNTLVITYAKFVYNWLIKPINPLLKIGSTKGKVIKGLDVYTIPEKPFVNGSYNPMYRKQNHYRHYLNKNNQLYISRMITLFNKQSKKVQNTAFARLARYCDVLYVDEAQDFRTQDYDLLLKLCKLEYPRTVGVGDYFQHSVSYTEQSLGRPFAKKKQSVPFEEYLKTEQKVSLVDSTTMTRSRRVPESICKLIRGKLGVNIYSKSDNEGQVIPVETVVKLESILNDSSITKIIYMGADKYTFGPTVNWTYSKGDNYESACVILTNTFSDLLEEDFSVKGIPQQEVNKLYVALTRSENDVYIVKRDLFVQINEYYKRVY